MAILKIAINVSETAFIIRQYLKKVPKCALMERKLCVYRDR